MKLKKYHVVLILIIATVFLVACNNTAYDDSENIVESSQVAKEYKSENVVLIDARGEEAFAEGHVLDAVCLPPSEFVIDKPVANTIAPKAKVERKLSAAGIANDSMVYIYDDNGGVSASRIWWTMKLYGHENVKVVNGGFDALLKEKLDGTTKPTDIEKTDYVAETANDLMLVDFEAVKTITEDEDSKVKIMDVRSVAEYDLGNIPGAILYPHTKNLYTDGTFMSERDTYLFYNDKGFNRDDEIILYCKSSFRAAQTLLVLEEAGFENVRIYDGAWLEWEANGGASDTPVNKAPITQQDGS